MPNCSKWCFTSWLVIDFMDDRKDELQYLVYGEEICPTTKKLHYQGYVEFKKKVSMKFIKEFFLNNDSMHLSVARGTADQNFDYCSKDGKYIEIGDPNYQGKQNQIAVALAKSVDINEFAMKEPDLFVRYHNGIQHWYTIKNNLNKQKVVKNTLTVLWGSAGSGKSTGVLNSVGEESYYYWTPSTNNSSGPWFDGYCGEKHLILDDFYGNIPYSFFLQLTDPWRKPIKLPVKGGHVYAQYDHIWITSNMDPYTWYKNVANKEGMIRRLDAGIVKHLTLSSKDKHEMVVDGESETERIGEQDWNLGSIAIDHVVDTGFNIVVDNNCNDDN